MNSHPISRRDALASLLGSALLLAGCGGGSSSPRPSTTPTPNPNPGRSYLDNNTGVRSTQPGWSLVKTDLYRQVTRKWTFLVYMNGANDLEEFGSLNINQMESIGSTEDLNLVVQFKRIPNRYDTSNGNWGNTRRYYVTADNDLNQVNSVLLSQYDNLDAGDWRTSQAFVQWGVQTFPAERYCLVVWNHGAGWRKVDATQAKTRGVSYVDATQAKTRGVSYDDITDNHIDTIDIPRAIDIGGGRKWDVLAFDASLMQMVEVAYEIRDKALYIVGSEESPPGEGYPYDRFLRNLSSNPGLSPRELAIDIPQQTIESYGSRSNITHSTLDASKVAALAAAVDELGRTLYNVKGFYANEIVLARSAAENYSYTTYRDLLDFVRLISEPIPGTTTPPVRDPAVLNACNLVKQRAAEAIIKNVNGSQHPNSNGIAIFLPTPQQFNDIDIDQANGFGQRYRELAFAKDYPNWQQFIQNGPR